MSGLKPGLRWRADSFAAAFPDRVKHGAGFVLAKNVRGEETMYATWMGGQDYQNKSKMYGAYPRGYLESAMSLFPDARRILHLFSGSLTAGQVDEAWVQANVHLSKLVDGLGGRRSRDLLMPIQIRFDSGLHPAARAAMPDVLGDAQDLARSLNLALSPAALHANFDLIFADPPYRISDQRKYWKESMAGLVCAHCLRGLEHHKAHYQKSTRAGVLLCASGAEAQSIFPQATPGQYARFKPLNKKLVIQQAAEVLSPGGYLVWLDEIRPPYDNVRWSFRGGMALLRSTGHRVRYATLLERRAS